MMTGWLHYMIITTWVDAIVEEDKGYALHGKEKNTIQWYTQGEVKQEKKGGEH